MAAEFALVTLLGAWLLNLAAQTAAVGLAAWAIEPHLGWGSVFASLTLLLVAGGSVIVAYARKVSDVAAQKLFAPLAAAPPRSRSILGFMTYAILIFATYSLLVPHLLEAAELFDQGWLWDAKAVGIAVCLWCLAALAIIRFDTFDTSFLPSPP